MHAHWIERGKQIIVANGTERLVRLRAEVRAQEEDLGVTQARQKAQLGAGRGLRVGSLRMEK
jgi:hypothetical protein